LIDDAQTRCSHGGKLTLNVCASYGGRWDIAQAAISLAQDVAAGSAHATAEEFRARLALSGSPDPDLLIRTGGESRISNFLLWQLAYAELYFTETLWPDFDREALECAITWYAARERRFGRTSEQLKPLTSDVV
jgi:undecaprenyl diphosphate synthase